MKNLQHTSTLTRWTKKWVRCCSVIFSRGSVQLSVQHSSKSKCSHCVARLHVFACNLTPLCNALIGRFVHQRSKILGMLCLSREPFGCLAVSNTSYFEGKFIHCSQWISCNVLFPWVWCIPIHSFMGYWCSNPWLSSNIQLLLTQTQHLSLLR